MSDTWQGEGWWIASDGKWYPPESHPDAVDAAPPVPVASVPAASVPAASAPGASVPLDPGEPAAAPPVPAAPTSRWLGRSPQPPAPAPATVPAANSSEKPPLPPTSSRWSKPRGAATPVTAPAAVAPVAYPLLDGPVQRRPPPRPVAIWVFISIGAVVLTVAIAFLIGFGGRGSLLVTERGTITVVFPRHGRPTFSGTIDGTALTGKVTDSTTSTGASIPGQGAPTTDSLVYKGRYGGNAYVLHLSLTTPAPNLDEQGDWEVTGTDGSSQVTGEATYNVTTEGDQVPFSGAIGSKPFNGTAVIERHGGSLDITVTYINLP